MSDVDLSGLPPEQAFALGELTAAARAEGYAAAVANLRRLAENTTGSFRQPYRNAADWLEEHAGDCDHFPEDHCDECGPPAGHECVGGPT